MNSMANLGSLTAIGGERLWRSNPVYCIEQLLAKWSHSDAGYLASSARLRAVLSTLTEQGVQLPQHALQRWAEIDPRVHRFVSLVEAEEASPRVVGLAVTSEEERDGYVIPLRPAPLTPPSKWRIERTLPFKADGILDALVGLLESAGLPGRDVLPERLAFEFENPLGTPVGGGSMTIAAVLAILDLLGDRTNELLRAAIALVEMDTAGRLVSVAAIPQKLEAAYRECGRLSLVVGPPGLVVNQDRAAVVWEVESLGDLSEKLHSSGLLESLLKIRGPLTRGESVLIQDRLRWLVTYERRYKEATKLGDRIRRVELEGSPDPAVWSDLTRLYAEACRHHGRSAEATLLAARIYQSASVLGDLGSDDDHADVVAEYAAALFNSHRFAEIPSLLDPWVAAIKSDPRRFRPLTRVKVWNTLGRTLSFLDLPNWDDLFGLSLDLNSRLGDDENVDRTTHYRVQARLRHGLVVEAREAFVEAGWMVRPDAAGNTWISFLRANISRLEGTSWEDQILERRIKAGDRPYSIWQYVQATGRQLGRDATEVQHRLKVAIDLLTEEAAGLDENICNLFAGILGIYAAAHNGDMVRWRATIDTTRGFLAATHSGIRQYYDKAFGSLPHTPDLQVAEALVDRVPYF